MRKLFHRAENIFSATMNFIFLTIPHLLLFRQGFVTINNIACEVVLLPDEEKQGGKIYVSFDKELEKLSVNSDPSDMTPQQSAWTVKRMLLLILLNSFIIIILKRF
ncbi:MAG: hypothetical protein LBT05_06600 [Planctomycetaceae bacterium]|jgi:hypothetical protein|nr:hypothetical protein [Planctomycetaceae bacterium]